MTIAVLLGLIGLTPGIMALLGAPSLAGLAALSVADKVTLATTVIGLLPHDDKTKKRIAALLRRHATAEGYATMEFLPPGGPGGWGRHPEFSVVWHSCRLRCQR